MSTNKSQSTLEADNAVEPSQTVSECVRPIVDSPIVNLPTKRRYIGVLTQTEAEQWIQNQQSTDFRFHHMWNPRQEYKTKGSRLLLVVVYRSSKDKISHHLVRTLGSFIRDKKLGKKVYVIENYYIERYGPSFKSLSDLIECYEDSPYLCNSDGKIEVFNLHRLRR